MKTTTKRRTVESIKTFGDLVPGDVITFGHGPYMDMTITKIQTDENALMSGYLHIDAFRVYVSFDQITGIALIGHEHVNHLSGKSDEPISSKGWVVRQVAFQVTEN